MRPVTTLNRWEKFSSKPWTTNNTVRFLKDADFSGDRVIRSLLINVQGTVALGTAAATALLADNVGAIIEQIRIGGKHSKRGTNDAFFFVRGADFKELQNEQAGVALFDNSSALGVGVGNYTLDFNLLIDFPPKNVNVGEQVGYMLDIMNWSSFEIDLQFADEKNLWNPAGTTTFAWSAQTVNILARYAQERGKFEGFGFGLVYRTFMENSTSLLTTTAPAQNLYQLDKKGLVRYLLLKTGVKATTPSAGNNAYSSLSDSILSNINLVELPTKQFRSYYRFTDLKAIFSADTKINPSRGYTMIDITSDKLLYDALDTKKLKVGDSGEPNLWLQADVVGAANQGLVVVQESLYYSDRIVIPTN